MQKTDELKKSLKELGYSEYYSRVILTLIDAKEYITAKDIKNRCGVPIERLYSILINLEKDNIIRINEGTVKKYAITSTDEMLQSIKEKSIQELEKKKISTESAISSISKNIENFSFQDSISQNIYTSDEKYWLVYAETVAKLMPGDIYRIINSRRLCESYLDEEIEKNPPLKIMRNNDREKIKQGVVIHYITNPKSLVENIQEEYNDKNTIKKAMQNLLKGLRRSDIMYNQRITIHPEFKNLVFIILKDDVFIELYGKSSSSISSVIHIRSKKIAEDFASWFDSLDKNTTHDPEKDYDQFEKEIKTQCRKIAGIDL